MSPAFNFATAFPSLTDADLPSGEDFRIQTAATALTSSNPFMREAGAQMLAGLSSPDALRLLEKACNDREIRVLEGGLRALSESIV